jgi:hypothetical protein
MLAIFLAGYGVGVPLSAARGHLLEDSTLLLAFAAFMAVGAVIVAHRPGNAVGWIFSAIGLLVAAGVAATEYAARASLGRPGALPGAVLAAWYNSWWWYPTFALVLVFTPLLFPTGRLLSARWRLVAAAAAAATVGVTALSALKPTLQDEDYVVRNPIGAGRGQGPGAERGGRGAVRAAAGLHGRSSPVAGAAVSPLTRGGAPAAQVVHLRRGADDPVAAGDRLPLLG